MRFLVHNAPSPIVAGQLAEHGHEAAHVRDYGLQSASDDEVMAIAKAENRFLISADTDFGAHLALSRESKPSVILFRRGPDRRPARRVMLLLSNLPAIDEVLERGSIVVFEERRLRVRLLPVESED